jgi:glutathione peroxidase
MFNADKPICKANNSYREVTMKIIPLTSYIILVLLFALSMGAGGLKAKEAAAQKNMYDFSVKTIDGQEQSLAQYKGNVVLIVNVASKCGFTPQYKGLQELYDKYKNRGFVVLGFPCNQFLSQEPGTNDEIKHFCSINFGVTFPMFDKIDVNGANAHPLYKYLTSAKGGFITDSIKWNFTKFLIDRKGTAVKRYPPQTAPENMEEDIKKLL